LIFAVSPTLSIEKLFGGTIMGLQGGRP
jgi:hypothetical protein